MVHVATCRFIIHGENSMYILKLLKKMLKCFEITWCESVVLCVPHHDMVRYICYYV